MRRRRRRPPTHRDHAGNLLGSASGQVWTDPDLILRMVCTRHRRQLTVLHAAGLAGQVRWQRPGLPTGPVPSREEQAQ